MVSKKAGVTTCETATQQGEESQHRYRHHQHNLLQANKCPGGRRALGFGVSGLRVVLLNFFFGF